MRPTPARRPALPDRPPLSALPWPDALAQAQALYEELLASQWFERKPPAPARRPPELSAHAITRDLAGWALPRAARPDRP